VIEFRRYFAKTNRSANHPRTPNAQRNTSTVCQGGQSRWHGSREMERETAAAPARKARTSECVAQGPGQRVRVKIAWRRGPDKRTLGVLVIIPAHIPRQLMAQIHAQVGDRLLILVLQRAERLQNVELRYAAVNTVYILVLSPPPATCSAPGPWQPSQPWCEGSLFSVVFQCGVFSQAL